MKVTKVINHEGKQYQFAAVEQGEKAREIRESLGWATENTLTFRKSEDEEMGDWMHWFDQAGIEVNMDNVVAMIENHIEGLRFS